MHRKKYHSHQNEIASIFPINIFPFARSKLKLHQAVSCPKIANKIVKLSFMAFFLSNRNAYNCIFPDNKIQIFANHNVKSNVEKWE